MREVSFPTFDYSALIGRIITVFGTRKKFANALGITPTTLSSKLSGASEWTQPEMYKASNLLRFGVEQIPFFFFTEAVEKKSTFA